MTVSTLQLVTQMVKKLYYVSLPGSYFIIRYYRKKYLNYPDNHDGVITLLEPDILECKVK